MLSSRHSMSTMDLHAMSSSITLHVLCPEIESADSGMTITLPKSATVREAKALACAEWFVDENEVELWDFFGGRCYAYLDDKLSQSLSSVRLMDKQSLLLRGKAGRKPSPLSLLHTSWTSPPDMKLMFDGGCHLLVHKCILELCSPVLQDILAQGFEPGQMCLGSIRHSYDGRSSTSSGMQCDFAGPVEHTLLPMMMSEDAGPSTPTRVSLISAPSTAARSYGSSSMQSTHTAALSARSPPSSGSMAALPEVDEQASPATRVAFGGLCQVPPVAGAHHRHSMAQIPLQQQQPQQQTQQQQRASDSGDEDRVYMRMQSAPCSTGNQKMYLDRCASKKQRKEIEVDVSALPGLNVAGDDRYAWMYCLNLLYPACHVRRPPITWSNVRRLLALADKWMIAPVMRVCEEFLLLPTTQFSAIATDPGYVWAWLVTADRLSMPLVIRKCISFVQFSRVTGGMDRTQLDSAVKEVVQLCSPSVVTQLITNICAFKDELQAVGFKR